MSGRFIVYGGNKLEGKVKIQGSKNAAFPVLAACLLTSDTCEIENVPEILDVKNFLAILKYLGARLAFKNHGVRLNASRIRNRKLPQRLVGKLRGSILLAGALLGRFGQAELSYPGGDAFGARPIDVHLRGFARLGAKVKSKGSLQISAAKLAGSKMRLAIPSVTGTENLILASVLASGITKISQAAREPHVQNLCSFLVKMGAKIEGTGTSNLKITGVKKLFGVGSHVLNPDEIDAVTFAVAAAATGGAVQIRGVELKNLKAPLSLLKRMRVNLKTTRDSIRIKKPVSGYRAASIETGVFPELLTDEQPLLGVLATQARGQTKIHDWFHEGRQGYLKALRKMGARVRFEDRHRAKIFGPTPLRGAEIKTPDLRAGASILIAALLARGKSIIYNAEIIDRGYEKIDERLRNLGAKIVRVD